MKGKTFTQYVAGAVLAMHLDEGLDLATAGGKITLTSKILKEIFHTDGVMHEGKPDPGIKAKMAPLEFYSSLLQYTDFAELLARYYETLLTPGSKDAAEAWLQKLLKEFEPYLQPLLVS